MEKRRQDDKFKFKPEFILTIALYLATVAFQWGTTQARIQGIENSIHDLKSDVRNIQESLYKR